MVGTMDGVARERPQSQSWIRWEILVSLLVFMLVSQFLPLTSAQRPGKSYACGAPSEGMTTPDGMMWESDNEFAPPGSKHTIVGSDYIRYFATHSESDPQQNIHCYDKLPGVKSEGPLLLRITYEYANYDGLDQPPEFQMWIGTAQVAYVNLKIDDPWIEEVMFSPGEGSSEQVFCIVAVKGAPVLSFMELRPLPVDSYSSINSLLRGQFRIDSGNSVGSVRYPDDEYDRIWHVDEFFSDDTLTLSSTELDGQDVPEKPPATVLDTLRTPDVGTTMEYSFAPETSGLFSVKLYTSRSRNYTATVNGVSKTVSSASGSGIVVTTFSEVADISGAVIISLEDISLEDGDGVKVEIYAVEVLQEIKPSASSPDAESMNTINQYYKVKLDWFGDPCLPVPWKGLQCSIDSEVTSLDLSGQNLALPILPEFSTLESLTSLNVSFNRFSQNIPDFTGLNRLEVLDLRNNDFTGTLDGLNVLPALTRLYVSFNPRLSGNIPSSLKRSSLLIDIQGTCIGQGANCNTSPSPVVSTPNEQSSSSSGSSNTGVIAGASIAAVLVVLAVLGFCIFFICWRKKAKTPSGGNADLRNWSAARVFTFRELESATLHFKKQLGEGSFGPVYYGVLSNGQKVAIKMRHDTSQLGADAFANEVYLLSRVHHPNLVPLLGYCQEGKNQLLVYEYMPGGTLMDHLYGLMNRLDWVARLRIAIGAATGISYLHNGSDPKIIHRDVKSTNILLDSNMTAKVSDFGLSKLVTKSEATHVTTLVKGTAGYLDPEYFISNQLTEKSDVYSFGVVLLEIICGREPLTGNRAPDEYNLIAWAKPYLLAKTYDGIVDRGLQNKFNPRSVSLVASLALRCIEKNGENRPTMLQVLRELEEALILEDRIERIIMASPSQSNSGSNSAAFDFRSSASDTPPDSAPQLANVPSFTFPR